MGKSRSGESSDSTPSSDEAPLTAAGWVGLGNSLRSSDSDRALAAFRRAVLIDPKNLAAWLSIAEIHLAGGEKRYAEDATKEVIALQPVGAEDMQRLCVLLLLLGREVDAERFGKRLLALKPDDKRSWSKLRSDLRATAMPRPTAPTMALRAPVGGSSEEDQKQSLPTFGYSPQTQVRSSVTKQVTPSRESRRLPPGASHETSMERSTPPASHTAGPPAPGSHEARPQARSTLEQRVSAIQDSAGQQRQAERRFEGILEGNPDCLNAAKLTETIQAAEKGLATKPDDPKLLYLLGSSALEMRDFSRARQALQRCTAVEPRNVAAWISLGYCHIREGHANDAARALLSAIRIDPDNAEALLCFARALMMQGQNERASSVLMKVLEIERASPVMLETAAGLLEASGHDAAAAKARARAALGRTPAK